MRASGIRSTSFFKNAALAMVSVVIALLLLEAGLRVASFFGPPEIRSAEARFEALSKNKWASELREHHGKTGYLQSRAAIDPFSGFVVKEVPRSPFKVNNIRLDGPDFPYSREKDAYNVLLLGGSVAHMVGMSRHLEVELQAKASRPVKVLIAAYGGWIYPQYFNIFTRYADKIDAVVTLEGFNEITNFFGQRSTFDELYLYSIAFGERMFADSAAAIFAYVWAEERVAPGRPLRHSLLAYELYSRVARALHAFIEARANLDRNKFRRMWHYPESIPDAQVFAWKLREYKSYWRMTEAIAKANGIRAYHFLQPIPSIGKEMTPKEREAITVYASGDLERFTEIYRTMKASLLELRREGIFAEDLGDIFQEVRGDFYIDHVHTPDQGNRQIAQRMARRIALPR